MTYFSPQWFARRGMRQTESEAKISVTVIVTVIVTVFVTMIVTVTVPRDRDHGIRRSEPEL
jgi:poly-D-alanine transfer protein DltD